MKAIGVILSCVVLAACGTPQKMLTVHSEPQGAIIANAVSDFRTQSPATLYYNIETLAQHRDADGCFRVAGLSAHWTSGATSTTNGAIRLCGNYNSWSITLRRPEGVPGIEQDVAIANQRMRELENTRILQELRDLRAAQMMAPLARGIGDLTTYGLGVSPTGNPPSTTLPQHLQCDPSVTSTWLGQPPSYDCRWR